jgi:hypothetical protein
MMRGHGRMGGGGGGAWIGGHRSGGGGPIGTSDIGKEHGLEP